MRSLPLNQPCVGRPEAAAAARAILSKAMVGRGEAGLRLEARIAEELGVRHALLTTSGTHALELAMAALGIGPGDEVLLPSFTFPSVANCVLRQRARPVFADVRLHDLNLDPEDAARRVTRRTRAVIPVHYAGISCDMDAIAGLAAGRRLSVVEDAAHAVGARRLGRFLGTIGDAGALSFHATKNITCGEGGALLTDDDRLAAKAELFREKGTNRAAFLRGEVRKYTWVSEGSSYVLSDILAAVLREQWGRLRRINAERGKLFRLYRETLLGLELEEKCSLPHVPPGCEPSYHLFYVLLPTSGARDRCMRELQRRGIGATFHFQPLHRSPFARKVLGWRERLRVSEWAADRLLRLPLYPGLRPQDVLRVCEELRDCLRRV